MRLKPQCPKCNLRNVAPVYLRDDKVFFRLRHNFNGSKSASFCRVCQKLFYQ